MALGFSPHLPVSVCGTGNLLFLVAFLASLQLHLRLTRLPFDRLSIHRHTTFESVPTLKFR